MGGLDKVSYSLLLDRGRNVQASGSQGAALVCGLKAVGLRRETGPDAIANTAYAIGPDAY